ncbi:MAG: 5'-nucleotidase C-terminal domain-containing protein [Armatimonadetes bacterium]|nr:5'-nucleotidase C-terminal domain-containing protein [Armatimonadota bacterium]
MITGIDRIPGRLGRVAIVEQSGFHGYLDPHPSSGEGAAGLVGGAAWLSSEIRSQRESNGDLLLMSGGDLFTGPDLSMKFDGRPVVEVMNHDGYDLWTLGNHDFDKGQQVLAELIDQARFPALAANLQDESGQPIWETDQPLHKVRPYCLKELGGARAAVVGLMKPDSAALIHPDYVKGLRFEDEESTLRKVIPELMRSHRPDCVVLHYQYLHKSPELCRLIRELAQQEVGYAPYVVAIGGHGYEEYQEPVERNGSLAVQSTDRGSSLNFLQLHFDPKERRVVGYEHRYLPIVPEALQPDQEVLQLLDGYRERLEQMGHDVVLASARGDFPRCKTTDSPVGNLITDGLREATGADIAFLAGGTVKAPIARGPVSRSTLREVLPFEDRAVTMTLLGSQVRQALEESLEPAIGAGKVLQMSGLFVTYDPEARTGGRVREVRLANGKLLDDDASYRVTVDDFLAEGGDGYTVFTGGRDCVEDDLVRRLVARGLQRRRILVPVREGTRLRALPSSVS